MIAILSYWVTRPLTPPKVSGYTRITSDGRAKSFRFDAFPVIVTDGLRLYFAEAANCGMRSTLNQVSASGGETSPVPTPFEQNIELGDIASNRSDLLLHTFVAGESTLDSQRLMLFDFSTPSKILSYICIPFSAVARFMGVIATL